MQLVKNAELLALQRLDEKSVKLQQSGKYMEALECMERGLVLRQHFFGTDSEEVWDACKTVGELCNLLAMTYLQQSDFANAEQLLRKAEILHQNDDKGLAVTYNNLACFYRRKGKLRTALKFLKKCLRIESTVAEVDNPGDTHLNMCAVLSQLGRHGQALEHARVALILLQEELFSPSDTGAPRELSADRIAVLAIAYHNIGVEQEFVKKILGAVKSYRKGVELAEAHLGSDHGVSVTLRNSLIAAQAAMARQKPRQRKLPQIGKRKINTKINKRGLPMDTFGAGQSTFKAKTSPISYSDGERQKQSQSQSQSSSMNETFPSAAEAVSSKLTSLDKRPTTVGTGQSRRTDDLPPVVNSSEAQRPLTSQGRSSPVRYSSSDGAPVPESTSASTPPPVSVKTEAQVPAVEEMKPAKVVHT